jgi:acetate kinase
MRRPSSSVLTLNGGSSSIRFAVFSLDGEDRLLLRGKIERIGLPGPILEVTHPAASRISRRLSAPDQGHAGAALLSWLEKHPLFASIAAVGHRVVHGMRHTEPEPVTPGLLAELRRIIPFDPDHLPGEIALIESVRRRHPRLPQVACFDTAFHRTMPEVARRLPLPRRYAAQGVERYGFHGLSYQSLMAQLLRLDPAGARERVVLAHLGNGASLAALWRGKSVDTSMGFTPAAGLVMSTRTGDLDPGLPYYFSRTEGMTPARFQRMVNHESGLLGVSGTSADVRDLLARERRDPRAAEALQLFCYQARKWIGSFAAALGGLDTLVFAGGIGENAPAIRQRICQGLGFLGISLDRKRNAGNSAVISARAATVKVRVLETDEELMIAKAVAGVLRRSSTPRP